MAYIHVKNTSNQQFIFGTMNSKCILCGLVWFLCLMVYQSSRVIWCQSHPFWKSLVVIFKPSVGDNECLTTMLQSSMLTSAQRGLPCTLYGKLISYSIGKGCKLYDLRIYVFCLKKKHWKGYLCKSLRWSWVIAIT